MDVYLSINGGVVTNMTIGIDVNAELSIPEGSHAGIVQIGWITDDGGETFRAPPQPPE